MNHSDEISRGLYWKTDWQNDIGKKYEKSRESMVYCC